MVVESIESEVSGKAGAGNWGICDPLTLGSYKTVSLSPTGQFCTGLVSTFCTQPLSSTTQSLPPPSTHVQWREFRHQRSHLYLHVLENVQVY
jgi:hypothetical protein